VTGTIISCARPGETMNRYPTKLSTALKKKLVKKKMPAFEQPMLATLTKNYFSDKEWIFERKFDGVRCLIFKNHDKVTLKSRNNKILNAQYPELVDAVHKLSVDQIILDGEVVSFEGKETSFSKLQARAGLKDPQKARDTGVPIFIYVFDILYVDGYDITHLPLIKRKSILESCIHFQDPLRYTIHVNTKGQEEFKKACKKGWEGVIAKRRDGLYIHKRSPDWLKFKCVANQELVVGGYTEPQGSRTGFGALLVGYYKKGKFIYAGKVGTGFSQAFITSFMKKLKKIETSKNPFAGLRENLKDVHFVKPQIVVEIGFEEWTKDNKLRQPRFQGIRSDKKATDVAQEKV
jgi:DNA ligase D-like protein (predicted ligase)